MFTTLRNTRSDYRSNRGFTLVELIVVMAIMSMIAVMLMFALAAARENAREAKTETMITKINELIMDRWSNYETRRVSIIGNEAGGRGRGEAGLQRLKGLRDLMRMEFPQRWKDVTTNPVSGVTRPAVSASYQRRYNKILSESKNPGEKDTYQSAECLFMILTSRLAGHGSAREHFKESEIGDIDGDGFYEFLDAWGQPVMFLRWAPAFDSALQREARESPSDHPDPWDPAQVDKRTTFALYPLIYSAGIDGEYDIRRKFDGGKLNDPFDSSYSRVGEPEAQDQYGSGGDPNGTLNHYDNIHNH